jgi:PAS domain S-box-containing protein
MIKFINDLAIKTQIIGIILLVTFLIHSVGFTYITIWDIKRIKKEIQTNLVLNTKLVANNCVVPLTFGDDEEATYALSHLKNIEFIESACLYDKEGIVFARYPDTLNENSILVLQEHQDNRFKDGFFYVKELVFYQNQMYGTLLIKANSNQLRTASRKIILTLILLSLVLDLLAIVLASKMHRYISLPIVKLKNHFDTVAQSHDYSQRIEKQNNDEIGDLYDEFNDLLIQIQNRISERVRAETQLRESQEKLDFALQGGDIGIWEWDLETNRVIWDTKVEKMFGLDEGSFKQTYEAFKNCLHPDDIALTEKAIKNAIHDNAPFDTIFRVVWRNNEIKFMRTKALLSKNEEGQAIKMIGVCSDVTEIKEAEGLILRNKNRLDYSLRSISTGAWELNLVRMDSWRSLKHDQIFGYSEMLPEWTYDMFLEHVIPKDREMVNEKFEYAISTKSDWNFECRINRVGGDIRWILGKGNHEINESNEAVKMFGVVQDITERKLVEEKMQESEKKYRSLLRLIPLPLCLNDNYGRITYMNERFEQVFGYKLNDIQTFDMWIEKAYPDVKYREWVRNSWSSAVEKAKKDNTDIESIEYKVSCKDGKELIILISGIIIEEGLLVTFIDITPRIKNELKIKKLNNELETRVRKRTAQLEAVNKELETFTYSVSHDLKAPLRGIDGYSKLLQDSLKNQIDEEANSFLTIIRDSALKMNQIIDDLLEFSRLERSQMRMGKIVIKDLIESIVSIYNKDLESGKFELNTDIGAVELLADSKGLTIALRNLIDNAIKFSKEKSKPIIKIAPEENSSSWIFCVEDNGIGFDMKYKEKIFEIFQRLHRAEEFPGTGIGLAMVFKAMQRMNGKVRAESTPGKGSTFFLEIPKLS